MENEQSKRSTPAVIAFTDTGREYGYNAIKEQVKKPESTILFFHNLFSRTFDSQNYFYRTFQPLELKANEDRNSTVVQIGKESFETEEIMAMLFQHAREMSEKFGEGSIKDCAITVPSFWTRGQRINIISSASAAGLNVLALMNENTGAAFYYGIDRLDNETDHIALFYNLGASYLQVTLAKYNSVKKTVTSTKQIENIEILAHAGDESLGGSLFDSLLASYLADQFKLAHKIDVKNLPKAMARLIQQANLAKKTLSANKSTLVIVNSIYQGLDFKYTLTREEFENLIKPYTERLVSPILEVLKKSGLEISDLDSFEIIGGVSRVPKVQEIIKERLGVEISTHLNGDESIAHGAAIYAANFSSVVQVKPMWLTDICTRVYSAKFSSVSDPEFKKEATLFKYGAKLGSKKKITFGFNKDLVVVIEELVNGEHLGLSSYQVSGIESIGKDEVSLFFSFVLDPSGIPFLHTADAKYEADVKKKDKKQASLADENNTVDEGETEAKETEEPVANSEQADTEQREDQTKDSENDKDSDNKNTTDTKDQTTKEAKSKQTKTKTISLKLQETELEQPKMLEKKDVEKIIKRLESFKESELQARKVAEAKNEIESYIYYITDRLEESSFIKVTSESERKNISEVIETLKE